MLTPSRRQTIVGALSTVLADSVLAGRLSAAAGETDVATLRVFLDTLLPADEISPAASHFGVAEELLEISASSQLYRRLLVLGCDWLNGDGQRPFSAVSESDRNRVVAWMANSDIDQIPGRFYQLVRLSALEIYYAHPENTRGFPLNDAPQPRGYPPPWQ